MTDTAESAPAAKPKGGKKKEWRPTHQLTPLPSAHGGDPTPVVNTSIKVTNAGDGLSNAVAVDPVEFDHGESVFVVLETEVDKVSYEESPLENGSLTRVHVLKTRGATIVDGALVAQHIAEQEARIRQAREKALGVTPLFDANGQATGGGEAGEGEAPMTDDEWEDSGK